MFLSFENTRHELDNSHTNSFFFPNKLKFKRNSKLIYHLEITTRCFFYLNLSLFTNSELWIVLNFSFFFPFYSESCNTLCPLQKLRHLSKWGSRVWHKTGVNGEARVLGIGKCRVLLRCHYSHAHSDSEYQLMSHLWVKWIRLEIIHFQ